MRRPYNTPGFTLMELLVGLLIVSLILTGVLRTLTSHTRIYAQQNIGLELEQNLRAGMDMLTEQMLASGAYLPPSANFSLWFPWVSTFTANPTIGTAPQKISIASITSSPVAYLNRRESAKATKIQLRSAIAGKGLLDVIDANTKRVIVVGDEKPAIVQSATSSEVTLDSDPVAKGNQGLYRSYAQDTPVFRIDVVTYSIETDSSTGRPQLRVNYNQGAGSIPVADGINTLQITPITAGQTYRLTLTAVSDVADPLTGAFSSRTLSSTVAVRNGLNDLMTSVDVTDIGDEDDADDATDTTDGDEDDVPIPPYVPPPPDGW
jgi:prepilin-type N-terminal cleavage/methylation domain-containing protein